MKMAPETKVLVTGGSGFFGETLCQLLLEKGYKVVVFDLNPPAVTHTNVSYIAGDIRDMRSVNKASEGVDIIHHNVAQVPLAKNKKLFHTVNYLGTKNILSSALNANVKKVVYTSSSAVFGVPSKNPVREQDVPRPMEPYGRAKLDGERACLEFAEKGLDVSIVRPRTIIGSGRLGIFQILFEWISEDKNIPLIGSGDNIYQFVHMNDLAKACMLAGVTQGTDTFNIGAKDYGSMRSTLQALIDAVGSKSKLVSLPIYPTTQLMKLASSIGISPLGAYHSIMYHRSMYFDLSHSADKLNFVPTYSNNEMFLEAYSWYLDHKDGMSALSSTRSAHQTALKKKLLGIMPYLLKWI